MRLWSLHPKYLDRIGLIALWREGLLARKVLKGETRGYKNHPQLIRFKNTNNPLAYIDTYLFYVYKEGSKRKYSFSIDKISFYDTNLQNKIPITKGQINYEFRLLLYKLHIRSKELYETLKNVKTIEVNPVFKVVDGKIENWEKIKDYVFEFK